MSDVIDHAEQLEDRIRENCLARWDEETDPYDIPQIDIAYAELLIAQMQLEDKNEQDQKKCQGAGVPAHDISLL